VTDYLFEKVSCIKTPTGMTNIKEIEVKIRQQQNRKIPLERRRET
jgi:hypothetical protein